ncbi:ABC transport system periplasmic binding component [Klebsiella pneumoniae subsp. pneumoniae]|nr:ABC transport system periplasmic binding component [Klebsiella pneumoniae subsp. pneumoniae]
MIYMPIYYTEGALIAVQSKQLGLNKPVVGGDGLAADQVFFDVGKDAVNGYMTTDYYSPNAKEQTPGGGNLHQSLGKPNTQQADPYLGRQWRRTPINVIVNAMNQWQRFPHDRVCVNEKIRATKRFPGRDRHADVTERRPPFAARSSTK